MLTNQVEPKKENIPHEDGEWISFSFVGWSQMEEAKSLKQKAATDLWNSFSGFTQDRLNKAAEEAEADATDQPKEEEEESDLTIPFDKAFVLNASIKKWSYEAPVNQKNIAALDDQTAEWAFGVAIRMNQRTKSEGEGSAPSSNGSTLATGATQPN